MIFLVSSPQYRKLRPPKEVTPKSDPLAWFRFAGNAILSEIHDRNYRWTWEHFRQRRDDRRAYVDVYIADKLDRATPQQKEELAELEKRLSYQDIRFYRSVAKSSLKREKAIIG
ncbi:hypothetical protein BC937DRAFT_90076 [Endogone sp. FLAS-F59071]|nr:hypothetical protein BC937DRAFT_90076 [Endogone sp. FLAS-F59071]|eukprot:RUS17356.1 hypothetical protein BC937DRAFT_90076 [Endogone sp. FLAS-F59071]